MRKQIPTSVAIRMEPEVRAAIEQAAKDQGRSLSNLIARVVADWAKAHGWLKEPQR